MKAFVLKKAGEVGVVEKPIPDVLPAGRVTVRGTRSDAAA
jgi:hypothetical protein